MQSRKTPCIYHPEQSITNFCRDKNCLMPLCPSCIRDHSLYHEESQTKPVYFNIYEILSSVQNDLYTTIYSLEQNKTRNAELLRRIYSLDAYIKEKVLTTKTMMYNLIDQAFLELETELKNSLAKLHDEIGIFSVKKSQKYEQSFNQMLHDLYNINDGLKGEKYLGNIIIFLKEKFQDSTNFNNKINSYLQSNESYQPKIQVSNQAKSTILANVGRLVKVEARKELDKKKQKGEHRNIFKPANKPGKDPLAEKNEKIERSYTPQKSSNYAKTTTGDTSSRVKINTNNSPYRQKVEMSFRYQQQPLSAFNQPLYPNPSEPNRIKDFKQEFEMLSKKVSLMKKENELLSKQYK